MHSVELKKTALQRLKKDIEQMEKETETKLADIDTQNAQLKVNTLTGLFVVKNIFNGKNLPSEAFQEKFLCCFISN